jgi:uncharacterized protein YndB with AHSA1/START domain
MQQVHESIFINAPREKVWDTMLNDATYREWTKPFNPAGSWFEGDWSAVGSTIKFLGPDPKSGTTGGMLSKVVEYRKPEYVAVEHYGMISEGVEDTTSEEVLKWAPSVEAYAFTEKDGGTQLDIAVDVADEYKAMFEEMWPKALLELKRLCEQ